MKRFFAWFAAGVALGTVLMFAVSARAADMPVKQPVYSAPPIGVFNWTGFYLEGHATGAWPNISPDGISLPKGSPSGWGGGAGAMFLYQPGASWVYGIKFSGDILDVNGKVAGGLANYKADFGGDIRGIIGYHGILVPGFLPYVTFGIHAQKDNVRVAAFRSTDTAFGPTIGGGLMMMLTTPATQPNTPQWAIFGEGLYDFAAKDTFTFGAAAVGAKSSGARAVGGLILRL